MNRAYLLLFALAATLLLVAPVSAHDTHTGEAKDQDIDVTFPVASGAFAELDMGLARGEEVLWSITSNVPVSMDIHSHQGTVRVHEKNVSTTHASGTFVAPSAGVFSIMVTALDEDAEVRLQVSGHFSVEGTIGFELPEENAAPAPVVALLVVALVTLAHRLRPGARRAR